MVMASSVSFKDLVRNIHDSISQKTLPLPDALLATITDYVPQHESHDDVGADRLHEELSAIFEKNVRGNSSVTGPWIAILRRLLPALPFRDRILPWFDACKDILDKPGVEKLIQDEAISALVDVVALSGESSDSTGSDPATDSVVDRLLAIWITKFFPSHDQRNDGNERIVRKALKNFGKKKPKDFFTSMDACFVKTKLRLATLRLLGDFIQDQPPHLHLVAHSAIFYNILTCLQLDTSTTVISSALTILVMLLPHMPSSLVAHLPTLFNIYARLLFWDREKARAAEASALDAEQQCRGWNTCTYNAEIDDFSIPLLSSYYTILYGLYPINFMDYIRKPQRYLRHANMSNPDEVGVEPTELRHRSERFRCCHLLHPNFYTLTIGSEKTDFGRWIKSEAAEVLVDCMCLRAAFKLQTSLDCEADSSVAAHHASELDNRLDQDVVDAAFGTGARSKPDDWRTCLPANTDSKHHSPNSSIIKQRTSKSNQLSDETIPDPGHVAARATDGPTALAQPPPPASQNELQDLIRSNKEVKSGLHQMYTDDSVLSASMSPPESTALAATAATDSRLWTAALSDPLARLQRRVLVLENDLSFERHVKQQHMAHIGELRRRQVVEAATEAEAQNLLMMNRNLKNRFEEAKKAETQVRKESEKGRALAKKWELDLVGKLKYLRDESKRASAELGALRSELDESKHECEKLRKLVCDAKVKEINCQQSMQSIEIERSDMKQLRSKVEELSKLERGHQAREHERKAALSSVVTVQAEVELMKLKLAAQEHGAEQATKTLWRQMAELKAQLAEAQEEKMRPGSNAHLVIESAFAASRAKQAELQKQFDLLTRKYTALQSSLLDMQSGPEAVGPPETGPATTEQPRAMALGESGTATTRAPQLLASGADGVPYNASPPWALHEGASTSAEPER